MLAVESTEAPADSKESDVAVRSQAPLAMSLEDARLMVEKMATSDAWRKMDSVDERIEQHPAAFSQLTMNYVFTPGIHIRECVMEAGDFISTRIHLTDHPFIVSLGRFLMYTQDQGVIEIGAPFTGITKAGTRRFIFILEKTIFSTIHANPENETDPDVLMQRNTYNNADLRDKARNQP